MESGALLTRSWRSVPVICLSYYASHSKVKGGRMRNGEWGLVDQELEVSTCCLCYYASHSKVKRGREDEEWRVGSC